MEIAIVTASAFCRKSGKSVSDERAEKIDLKKNILFKNCKNVLDIKKTYESFWNETNPISEHIVFVSSVEIKK